MSNKDFEDKKVVIYQGKSAPEIVVKLEDDEVWLNRKQIAELFGRDVKTIGKHIGNAITEELRDFSVVAKFATTATDGKTYMVEHYGLDVILSVGYRVKSAEGVRFRIWANNVLKKYMQDGVAVNEKRIGELDAEKLKGLEGTLGVVKRVMERSLLSAGEANGILEVISRYATSWKLIEEYDEGKIVFSGKGRKARKTLPVAEAEEMITRMREEIGAGELFGKVRENGLDAVLGALYQSFDGRDVYRTVAEKAANLLYLVIKDHPFYDGNKRIGSFLFIVFLTINDFNLTEKGECKISDRALVAIALMIAESEPREKEVITALVARLLEG
jgi:death-on-curing family protein